MRNLVATWAAVILMVAAGVPAARAAEPSAGGEPSPNQSPAHWFKGNLHTHSLWSDGDDFPEMIVDWYKSHGYDFLALSDHNVLSEGERWIPTHDAKKPSLSMAIGKYRKRFGDSVEVRQSNDKGEEIRLQPLSKVRTMFEAPGKFMMIQAEEVSDKFGEKPVHMGAVNLKEVVQARHGNSVREVIANNLRAIEEEADRTGVPAIAHLNHPNFGWGVTAEDLAAVVEEHFFECYNGHPIVHHLGDAQHPSVEHIWDIANTIRLAQLSSEPLMGLGSDDTHNYHVTGMNRATPGRGWVMVRAAELKPEAIVAAIKKGDFYASSGVTLKDVRYDAASKTLSLEINPDGDAAFTTQFVGTPRNFADSGKTPLNSDKVGAVFATSTGTSASYTLKGDELYVRAVVTSNKPPANPSFENQKQQAWTQPVGWALENSADRRKSP